jgi:AcrR family transcriptional regulator
MPRPRFERAPVEKREAILEAAAKEFAEHGYEDASVNRIILAAGFSKGSFYYYFDDKGDLAAAVIERHTRENLDLLNQLREPRSAEEFWSEVARFIEIGSERLRQAPHATLDSMMRLGTALSRHPELLGLLSNSLMADVMATAIAFWTRGQKLGAVRSDLSPTQLIALFQDTKLSLIRIMLPSDHAPSIEQVEAFVRVHMDLIRRISEPRKEG